MGVGNVTIGSHKTDFCFAQSFRNVHTLRHGVKSGPMRRASTGTSPLLRLWWSSPEVAVKSLAGEKAFTKRTALQPSLLLLLSIGKVILLLSPHRHATRTPHTSNSLPEATLNEGSKPLGFVAYSMFLRSVIPHRVCNLPPKFAWSRPTRSRTPKR